MIAKDLSIAVGGEKSSIDNVTKWNVNPNDDQCNQSESQGTEVRGGLVCF
jgi:hypothetical protein